MARIKSRKNREEASQPKTDSQISAEAAENKFEALIILLYLKIKDSYKQVVAGVLAVVAILATVIIIQAYNSSFEKEALQKFEVLRESFRELSLVEVDEEKNRLREKYITLISDFRKEYEGSAAADTAALYLVNMHQYLGQFEKAAVYSEEYAKSRENQFLRTWYLQTAASYYEEAGMKDKAKNIYDNIDQLVAPKAQQKNDIFTLNQYQLARYHEMNGEKDKALETYKRALDNLDPQAQNAALKNIIRTRYLYLKHKSGKAAPVDKP